MSFAGKTVLVTGAARGIGKAVAALFAGAGASVAMIDRDAAQLEAAAHEIAPSDQAWPIVADIGQSADVNRAVHAVLKRASQIDVLVSNAGIHFARRIDDFTDEEWNRILTVNLTGAFYTIRAALPALRQARGAIVIVSSMTGLVGQDRGSAYVASKGGLISLTKALALELAADGIRVNCVCPAGVDTPLMRAWAETLPDPAAVLKGQAEMHLMNRMATPAEIAEAIAFLASPAASFMTGVILPVEGGATLGYRRC